MDWKIKKAGSGLKGEIVVPPDKSVSHRAVMFASIAAGSCRISNFLFAEDCMRTYEAFRSMGVDITRSGGFIEIKGQGMKALEQPAGELYMGNSGTSMRILSGILAGQDFPARMTGDESLSRRPMRRVIEPLLSMGAVISSLDGGLPPISTGPRKAPLKAISYRTPVASAQVKSCVLAAGLYADGVTSVTEPFQSRDHTERMLEYFAADIERQGLTTSLKGLKELSPRDIEVPGDISSAAFFIVAALLADGSDVILRKVGLNSTRDGALRVLKRMGGRIEVLDVSGDVEPQGDIRVRSSSLKGTVIEAEEIPLLIDEVPVLAVAAAAAEGATEIRGISELKVKESDRVKSVVEDLTRLGAEISEEGDRLIIPGGSERFEPADLESFGDHRIAMSMAVAALISGGECVVRNTGCVETSYPAFLADLEKLRA